jgi:putative ABC transport system permease protein
VEVGTASLRLAAILTQEPDRAGDLFSIAPRLMMNMADLAATGLIQPGSRATYRLLVAGDEITVGSFRSWASVHQERGERLETVKDARPEVRAALSRAGQFLGLAALTSVVLAAVAVAMAARRFMQRHLDGCAVMRCLGARQATIFRLYLYQFMLLGTSASLIGCLVGYGTQGVLVARLGSLVTTELPLPSPLPVLQGVAVGLATLLGFALPPLMQLKRVPALRVLRRELGPPAGSSLLGYTLGVAVIAGLLLWQAGDLKMGGYVLGGLASAVIVAALLALGLMRVLTGLRGGMGAAWRYGLANVTRRRGGSIAQVAAFGLGMLVLLLLTVVRGDLLHSWQSTLPPDAPNRFIINIQPDQVKAMSLFFQRHHMPVPGLFPMVRGRLVAINGREVQPESYADDRARRLAEREFNLSWAERPQSDNRIVAGRWWAPAQDNSAQLSMEEGIAKTLGIKLGDTLTYSVAGSLFDARVTSLRKVDWDSFRVNFFVIGTPGLLKDYPASYITSFHLAPTGVGLLDEMVRAFPNLTVIDVAAVMDQVRGIMDRVAGTVEFVFLFTLLAGFMVLFAAIAASRDERVYEAAVWRVLGARRRQLLFAQFAEFAGIGLLAGITAAIGAGVLQYVLSEYVLHLPYVFNPWVLPASALGSALAVGLAGVLGTWTVLTHPPLETLRLG